MPKPKKRLRFPVAFLRRWERDNRTPLDKELEVRYRDEIREQREYQYYGCGGGRRLLGKRVSD